MKWFGCNRRIFIYNEFHYIAEKWSAKCVDMLLELDQEILEDDSLVLSVGRENSLETKLLLNHRIGLGQSREHKNTYLSTWASFLRGLDWVTM